MSSWGNIAKGIGIRTTKHQSLLESLTEHAIEAEPELRAKVFRMAAERVRTRVLSEADAKLISGWLMQLADGQVPIPMKQGPRHKDDQRVDIYWSCRNQIEAGAKPKDVYKAVGEHFGLSPKRIANIYSEQKKQNGK